MQIRTSKLVWSAAGLFAVGTAAGLSAPTLLQPKDAATPSSTATPAATATAPGAQSPLIGTIATPNYRAIVAQNRDAVVGITTAGEMPAADVRGPQSALPGGDDNPLSQFFHGIPMPRNRGVMHAQGSGFVVTSDGVILTNAHVVDGAKEVIVKLADHREYKAKVLGADKSSDIAVLKIEAHNLPFVRLGNSDQLGVGDYVLAIGEPFGWKKPPPPASSAQKAVHCPATATYPSYKPMPP